MRTGACSGVCGVIRTRRGHGDDHDRRHRRAHLPRLAVADELARRGARVFWLGTHDGMESRLCAARRRLRRDRFGSVRGKGLKRLILGPYAILNACRQAFAVIGRRAPGVVLGFGGFASFPGALMAVARNLPLIVHNLDARRGLANRVLRHGADPCADRLPGRARRGRTRVSSGSAIRCGKRSRPPRPPDSDSRDARPRSRCWSWAAARARSADEAVPEALALSRATAVARHAPGRRAPHRRTA